MVGVQNGVCNGHVNGVSNGYSNGTMVIYSFFLILKNSNLKINGGYKL